MYFCIGFRETDEETTQVVGDSGTHAPAAVRHTCRPTLPAARSELGGAEGDVHRLGEDRHGHLRRARQPGVAPRPGHRRLPHDQAKRLAATGERHHRRRPQTDSQRAAASPAATASGDQGTLATSGEGEHQRLHQRPAHQGQFRRTVATVERHRLGTGDRRGERRPPQPGPSRHRPERHGSRRHDDIRPAVAHRRRQPHNPPGRRHPAPAQRHARHGLHPGQGRGQKGTGRPRQAHIQGGEPRPERRQVRL